MHTYFISDGTLVKIGRSLHPSTRVSQLQTGASSPLTVLLTLPGDHEHKLHNQFAAHRINGEWFVMSYDIRKFIAEQSRTPLRMSFYVWLQGQQSRRDDVGRFAAVALADPSYPKDFNRLQPLRKYFNGKHKRGSAPQNFLKQAMEFAHAEWRNECTANDGRYER